MVRSDVCANGGGSLLMVDNDHRLVDVEECDDEVDIVDSGEDMGDLSPTNPMHGWSTQTQHQLANALANPLAPPSHLHISNSTQNGSYSSSAAVSPCSDPDRRLRRQIANCNERRRMQSINSGFQALRSLLPKKDGEKLSKAAILQQTAELIQSLQGEKQRLIEERNGAQWKKRRLDDCCELQITTTAATTDDTSRQLIEELQSALERERNTRLIYETQLHQLSRVGLQSSLALLPQSEQNGVSAAPVAAVTTCTPSVLAQPQALEMRGLPLQEESHALPFSTPSDLPLLSLAITQPEASVSVIRPTASLPGMDTSPPSVLCVTTQQQQQMAASVASSQHGSMASSPCLASVGVTAAAFPLPQLSFPLPPVTTPNTSSVSPSQQSTPPTTASSVAAHRSLNVILDAIRHLEGGAFANQATPPSTPTSHSSNLMVR